MTRYIFSYRVQLLGLSLIGLLALIVMLLAQARPLASPEIDRRAADSSPAPSAVQARKQAEAEAADTKLQDPGYLETLTGQIRINPLANVHPADRKFFTGNYVTTSAAEARGQAEAEAADRKLQDPGYLETLMNQMRRDR